MTKDPQQIRRRGWLEVCLTVGVRLFSHLLVGTRSSRPGQSWTEAATDTDLQAVVSTLTPLQQLHQDQQPCGWSGKWAQQSANSRRNRGLCVFVEVSLQIGAKQENLDLGQK